MLIKVVAIDDHPLVLSAIETALKPHTDIELSATAEHGSEIHRLVKEKQPDVVLLDLGMSGVPFEPIREVRTLLANHPLVRVIILTNYDSPTYISELTRAGAKGYLLKNEKLSMELPEAIRAVYRGERFFSPVVSNILLSEAASEDQIRLSEREHQVMKLVAQGYQNGYIAREIGVSANRVRNILSRIYDRFGIEEGNGEINSRVMAINKARELGLL